MPPAMLLERQLARLSGVPLGVIRKRQLDDEQRSKLAAGLDALRPILGRLTFVGSPFCTANVAHAAMTVGASVVVVDYVQRFKPGDSRQLEERASIDAVMGELRTFCNAGLAVLAIAALNRVSTRPTRGSNAGAGLSLSSFRGSAELEYACDDAYLMSGGSAPGDPVIMSHAKSRYGACKDITLTFDKPFQRFIPDGLTPDGLTPAPLPPGITPKAGSIAPTAGKFGCQAAFANTAPAPNGAT